MQQTSFRLAVLIDGDNVSAKHADGIFARAAALGYAQVRRLYGNLAAAAGWKEAAERHALMSRQCHPVWKSKNAADIAMVIDAMDILHAGQVDGFCIVSSDCDFMPLAIRLREAGKVVYGFGGAGAVESYRSSFAAFFPLHEPAEKNGREAAADILPKAVVADELPVNAVLNRILTALRQHSAAEGWVDLATFCGELSRLKPPVTHKDVGRAKFSSFFGQDPRFELKGQGEHMRLREVR